MPCASEKPTVFARGGAPFSCAFRTHRDPVQVKYNVEVAGLSGRPREPEAHGTRRPFRKGEDSNPAVMTAVSVASSSAGVPTHTNYVSKEEFEAVRAAAQREILALMQKLSEREVIATCADPCCCPETAPALQEQILKMLRTMDMLKKDALEKDEALRNAEAAAKLRESASAALQVSAKIGGLFAPSAGWPR